MTDAALRDALRIYTIHNRRRQECDDPTPAEVDAAWRKHNERFGVTRPTNNASSSSPEGKVTP